MTKGKKAPRFDPLYDQPASGGPPLVVDPEPAGRGVDLPEFEAEFEPKPEEDQHGDSFESAVRMSFLGAGQGGGRIAEAFAHLGYRRVCAINTTYQDMADLRVPHKLVIGKNRGGAGKDPEEGRLAAEESSEDIVDLMMRAWGEGTELVWICLGSGGGSGTGSWLKAVELAHQYCRSTNIEKPFGKNVGVIMTLPKRSEGARVQKNALGAVKQAVEAVAQGTISALVLVDNARIHELFPRLPVKRFWQVANNNFGQIN